MRIISPKCPCGGEYAVKDGSINCKSCGKPMHSKPLRECFKNSKAKAEAAV